MDFLRLPATLRRSIISQAHFRRYLTTITNTHDASPLPLWTTANLTLSSADLNTYSIAIAPNSAQLKHAHNFFTATPPTYLFTAPYFRSFPPSPHPEVAFLGRSNVGKSSLLNALFGRTNARDAHVSKRPGRTRTMNGFGVSGGLVEGRRPKEGEREGAWKRFPKGGVVVVDMPGYGGGSHEEWGREALKYLEGRKQLRRTFVLVDAEHGLKRSDVQILTHLRRQGIAHQIIVSKVDKLLYPGAKPPGLQRLSNGIMKLRDLCEGVREQLNSEAGDGRKAAMDFLCVSSEKSLDERNRHRKIGVDEVRWAILSACGLECGETGKPKKRFMSLDEVKVLEDD